jgi:hypothetical protein
LYGAIHSRRTAWPEAFDKSRFTTPAIDD